MRRRRLVTCALALGMVFGMVALLAPPARADDPGMWQLGFSGKCASADLCLGFTTFQGSCTFTGTRTSGSSALCLASFSGVAGVAAETIRGTAWDVEPSPASPAGPGANDWFVNDGTVTYAGPEIALALLAGFSIPGCTTTGATLTCPIPVVEAAQIYSPDTFNAAVAGHLATNACFGTANQDPGCSYVQQATFVG